MGAIFMNSENSKTSDPYRQLFKLSDKIYLKKCDKYFALLNLRICYQWKNIKDIINLKSQLQCGMGNSNYLTDCILC